MQVRKPSATVIIVSPQTRDANRDADSMRRAVGVPKFQPGLLKNGCVIAEGQGRLVLIN
jgi:hypothetical protein